MTQWDDLRCISLSIHVQHGIVCSKFIKGENVLNAISKHAFQYEPHEVAPPDIILPPYYLAAENSCGESVNLFGIFYYSMLQEEVVQLSPRHHQVALWV